MRKAGKRSVQSCWTGGGASLAVTMRVRIIDNAGRIIKQQQTILIEGSNALSLDVSGLTKGIYVLELKGETVNERKQFVKL